ncbi:L-type lectin-domain containing receptor kinase IX.1 [Linum grandiflorum]
MKVATMIFIIISTFISSSLFFISICHAAPLSFNFTNFDQCSDSIRLSAQASCLNSINLTSSDFYIFGQAKYSKPMRLWDASTGDVANFTTTFTFATDNNNGTWTCDGLAFFIASSNYSTPAVNASDGLLGLVDTNHKYNSTPNPFIAVEFDTYNNPEWDIWNSFSHVGIDVNSIQSVTSKRWRSYANGTTMWAQVSYRAKNLCVEFTGLTEDMTDIPRDTLCYQVDLKDYLTEWAVVGFSASTAFRYQSHTIKSWAFSSDLDGERGPSTATDQAETQSRSGRKNTKKKKKNTSLTIGLPLGIIGAFGLVIVGVAISIFYKRRETNRRRQLEAGYDSAGVLLKEIDGNRDKLHPINAGARFIPAEEVMEGIELLKNTVLGAGGFGAVYKAELGGETVAVKKIFQQKRGAVEGYMAELTIIAQLRHENLVRLIGWSYDNVKGEFYLVYEYMKNGSLDGHLYKQSELLEWKTRYGIAKDLARVLYFLHERCTECVLHRDIKSSNVLLDSQFNAKLGDFGLARVVERDAGSQTLPGFTHGYLAPECIHNPKTSKETDTFSFGVVALEIACGRKPDVKITSAADQRDEYYVHISRWVWDLYGEGNVFEAVDMKLKGKFVKEEMHRLLMVGLHCAHPDPKQRPSMKAAMEVLEFNVPLVNLPLQYPTNNSSHTMPRILEQYSSVSSGPSTSTNRSSSST